MRLSTGLILALLAASPAVAAPVFPKVERHAGFTRVAVLMADPREPGLDNGWGALLQIGGGLEGGDLLLEIGHVRFEQTESVGTIYGDFRVHADLRVTPMLVTARWRWDPIPKGRVSTLLGISGGFSAARISGEVYPLGGEGEAIGNAKASRWLGTFGGDACIEYALRDSMDLFVGVKYLNFSGSTWSVEGADIAMPAVKATAFYAGLGWRW